MVNPAGCIRTIRRWILKADCNRLLAVMRLRRSKRVAASPATPRHPSRLLPLLPSGRNAALMRCRRTTHAALSDRPRMAGPVTAPRMAACHEVFLFFREEWQPRQPHPGTRVACCRCFLPDLAEFTSYRREGTDEATIKSAFTFSGFASRSSTISDRSGNSNLASEKIWRRERDSNPRSGVKPLTHFPGVLLQPLGHLSTTIDCGLSWHDPRRAAEDTRPAGIRQAETQAVWSGRR